MNDETDNGPVINDAKLAGMRIVDVPESVRSLTWHLHLEVDDNPAGDVRLYIIFTSMGRVDYGQSPVLEFNHPLRHRRLLAKAPRAGFKSDEVIGAWLDAVNQALLRIASSVICANLALHANDAAQVLLGEAGLPPINLEQLADEHLAEVRSYVRQLLGLKGARGARPLNERALQGFLLEVFRSIDPARLKKLSIEAAIRYAHRKLKPKYAPQLIPDGFPAFKKILQRHNVNVSALKRSVEEGQSDDLFGRLMYGFD